MNRVIALNCILFNNEPHYFIHYAGLKAQEISYAEFKQQVERLAELEESKSG